MRRLPLGAMLAVLLAVAPVAGCASTLEGRPSYADGSTTSIGPRTTPTELPTGPDNTDNSGGSIDESLACIQAAVQARQILDIFDGLKDNDPVAKWKRVAGQLDVIRRKLDGVSAPLPQSSKLKANLADIQEELREAAVTLRAGAYDIKQLLAHIDELKRICQNL